LNGMTDLCSDGEQVTTLARPGYQLAHSCNKAVEGARKTMQIATHEPQSHQLRPPQARVPFHDDVKLVGALRKCAIWPRYISSDHAPLSFSASGPTHSTGANAEDLSSASVLGSKGLSPFSSLATQSSLFSRIPTNPPRYFPSATLRRTGSHRSRRGSCRSARGTDPDCL
jgi:hypothetical protein